MAVGDRFYSPEQVAEILGLHVRTVRRYIREGKLNAVRIGNRYRITADDLEAFSGLSIGDEEPSPSDLKPRADVTCVVDLHPIGRDDADRLTTLLMGGAIGRERNGTSLRVEAIHDPQRQRLKVVVVGTLTDTSAVLALITMHQESD